MSDDEYDYGTDGTDGTDGQDQDEDSQEQDQEYDILDEDLSHIEANSDRVARQLTEVMNRLAALSNDDSITVVSDEEHQAINMYLILSPALFSERLALLMNLNGELSVKVHFMLPLMKFTVQVTAGDEVRTNIGALALATAVQRAVSTYIVPLIMGNHISTFYWWNSLAIESRYDIATVRTLDDIFAISVKDNDYSRLITVEATVADPWEDLEHGKSRIEEPYLTVPYVSAPKAYYNVKEEFLQADKFLSKAEALFLRSVDMHVRNLTCYCVVCGCSLGITVPHFMYCASRLCRDIYLQLESVGLADLIRTDPEVADIKLNLYYNFLNGDRSELNLPLYLTKDMPDDKTAQKRHIIKLLYKCGSVDALADSERDLPRDVRILYLWILTQFHLYKREDKVQASPVKGATHVYRLYVTDFKQVTHFQDTLGRCLVRTVYHGSRPDSWYNILAQGLSNMSNSKYQAVGAVYGAGIYVGSAASVSQSYSVSFPVDRPGTIFKLHGKSLLLELLLSCPSSEEVAGRGPGMFIVKKGEHLMPMNLYVYGVKW